MMDFYDMSQSEDIHCNWQIKVSCRNTIHTTSLSVICDIEIFSIILPDCHVFSGAGIICSSILMYYCITP